MEERQIMKGCIIMLPVFIVKVVEVAVGVAIGNLASDTVDKVVDGVKKIVEAKKGEGK